MKPYNKKDTNTMFVHPDVFKKMEELKKKTKLTDKEKEMLDLWNSLE